MVAKQHSCFFAFGTLIMFEVQISVCPVNVHASQMSTLHDNVKCCKAAFLKLFRLLRQKISGSTSTTVMTDVKRQPRRSALIFQSEKYLLYIFVLTFAESWGKQVKNQSWFSGKGELLIRSSLPNISHLELRFFERSFDLCFHILPSNLSSWLITDVWVLCGFTWLRFTLILKQKF